jgi:CheY-like chemotaxis protein
VASRVAGARFCLAVLLAGVEEQRLILVVEDDEATRSFLLDNLAADGFRVAGASGGRRGVAGDRGAPAAHVVLDLRLEGGSGLDVLDAVRSADGLASRLYPDLPVTVVTGRSGDADIQRGGLSPLVLRSWRSPDQEGWLPVRGVSEGGGGETDGLPGPGPQTARPENHTRTVIGVRARHGRGRQPEGQAET